VRRSEDELDHLLAAGRLGGPARERILTNVLAARGEVRGATKWRWASFSFAALTAVAALSAFVLWPKAGDEARGFRAKGTATSALPAVEIACVAASGTSGARAPSLAACPVGASLLFGAAGLSRRAYVEAYAEPKNGGERIWYFSAEKETPLAGAPGGETQPARRGIRVGREHRPGAYLVHTFLTERPVGRADLLSPRVPGLLARARFDLEVVAE
jgi:hypothetical protein